MFSHIHIHRGTLDPVHVWYRINTGFMHGSKRLISNDFFSTNRTVSGACKLYRDTGFNQVFPVYVFIYKYTYAYNCMHVYIGRYNYIYAYIPAAVAVPATPPTKATAFFMFTLRRRLALVCPMDAM